MCVPKLNEYRLRLDKVMTTRTSDVVAIADRTVYHAKGRSYCVQQYDRLEECSYFGPACICREIRCGNG